jgi:hypothetical protein
MQCPSCSTTVFAGQTVCHYCQKPLSAPSEDGPQKAPLARERQEAAAANPPVVLAMPVHRPFRKLMLGMLVALVLLGGYALVALLLGEEPRNLPVLASIIVSGVLLITLPIMFWFSSLEWTVIRRMLAGDYLVRWTYGVQEWRDFAEDAWARARRIDGLVLGALVLVVLVPAFCIGAGNGSHPGLFGQVIVVVGIVALVGLMMFGNDYWLYRQRLRGAGEVLVSRAGMLRPEGFVLLVGLYKVTLKPGYQTILNLECRQQVSQNGVPQTRYQTYEVPVPYGHEAEAEQLVQQFQQVQLQER